MSSIVICGTGHRPDKLGGYGKDVEEKLLTLARDWCLAYEPGKVISGGALGWDQALAWGAYFSGVPYVMALPFPGFEDRWPQESKNKLYSLMATSKENIFVSEGPYAGWKMQVRNQWMVDHADQVLALWNGSTGGTSNCIQYANKVKKPIINLWDSYESPRSV